MKERDLDEYNVSVRGARKDSNIKIDRVVSATARQSEPRGNCSGSPKFSGA